MLKKTFKSTREPPENKTIISILHTYVNFIGFHKSYLKRFDWTPLKPLDRNLGK